MSITFAVREAVREAVETAEVETIEVDGKPRLGDVHFTVAARDRIQQVVSSPDRLNQASAACEAELMRQIMETKNLHAAKAAYVLQEMLPGMQPHRKAWVMDPDGTLRPINPPE